MRKTENNMKLFLALKRLLALSLFFILFPFQLLAQKTDLQLKDNYHGLEFEKFADTLKTTEGIQIFYKSEWLDTLVINQTSSSLSKTLSSTLKERNLNFEFYQNYIIVSQAKPISPLDSIAFAYSSLGNLSGLSYNADVQNNDNTEENTNKYMIVPIGNPLLSETGTTATITGVLRNIETGEPLLGAQIYVEDLRSGTITDFSGYYVLNIPRGRHQVTFRCLGMQEEKRQIIVYSNGEFNLDMNERILELKGVVVTAEKDANVSSLLVGVNKLDIRTIKSIPTSIGEVDIIKAALLLPGVQTVGEASSGFNVRGGSTGQNLILLNEAPIFNPSHLFGFFSVFHPDLIQDFKLYKSGIPANYGGRVSSVLDISTKSGNRKEFTAAGGISPISGRVSVEGPIIKDKVSFIAGARSTYSDWILKRINTPSIQNSSASFYDLTGKVTADIDKKNQLSASAYYSKDYFKLNSDTSFNYSNACANLTYKHIFNKKLIGRLSAIYSNYYYEIGSTSIPEYGFKTGYEIDYKELKARMFYYPNLNHNIEFGASSIFYNLNPGSLEPVGNVSLIQERFLEEEQGVETSIYLNDEIRFSSRISTSIGLRYALFLATGPGNINIYAPNSPIEEYNITNTEFYKKGGIIQSYNGLEPRLSMRYSINSQNSVKLAYNRIHQFIHMLSNTTSISPTDTWKLSDPYISPQRGDQVAFGYYRNLRQGTIELSGEIYYKYIKDIVDYKPGAQLIMNDKLETDILNGTGNAYGFELMLNKKTGKFNGWLSYTYSKTEIQIAGNFPEEIINNGSFFPANHDKPHDVTMVSNFKFNRRLSISSNVTYSTGRPITYPVAQYHFQSYKLLHYSNRNEFRVPDYFRWDVSVNVDGNLKSKKIAHNSWSFSVYNLTGRKNVYSIYFVSKDGQINGYKMSIFARPIFSATYNFKF